MKVRIKTFNGDLPRYLTIGRNYNVIRETKQSYIIIDNDGYELPINKETPSHLLSDGWVQEVVNEG